ncbi:MAG: EAL domain-containing response regulator [Pararhodobacter sp.]|nr:EAL domain-containing response regulator [Pararhodobacter sp.]
MTYTASSNVDGQSVLVLDDDSAVAEIITAMAISLGAQARFVCCADDFFRELDQATADVVIIDLQMPGRDGLEVMRELGTRGPVQVILTSGCDSRVLETARHSARINGLDVVSVLPKPVRRTALLAALKAVQVQNDSPKTAPIDFGSLAITAEMIKEALTNGQIRAHFQPKLRLRDHEPCGFEALARWEHPEMGMISPGVFVPLASMAELDRELCEVMLDQSLSFLAELGDTDLCMAVNVPMRVCAEPAFPALLDGYLQRFDLTPARLILEITEAGPVEMAQGEIDALTRLRMRGYSLSIDDFGTGVSSLERLVRIPFNELKIDRYFARDISTSPGAAKLVRNLVRIAKSMDMSVTIEGVEDAAMMQLSRELGCDIGQGFHIARPMPAEMARTWLIEQAGRLPV